MAEALAIRTAIGDHALVTATKSQTGHLLGAAGALESIVTVLACATASSRRPATSTTSTTASSSTSSAVEPRRLPVPVAVNDSFGFGGHNVAVAIRKI